MSSRKHIQFQDNAQEEDSIQLLDHEGKARNSESGEDEGKEGAPIPPPEETIKRGLNFWLVITGLIFTLMLSGLEANITATALPTIVHELGQSNQFVWILHSFTLASTVIQPPIGQLADVFGRKTPMLLSVLSFTVGSLISGLATNMGVMILGRVLQGCGSGGTFVLADLIVSDIIPLRERPAFMGILMTGSSIAYAAGPSIGGMMTEYLSWRWAYLINVPVGILALVVLAFSLRLKQQTRKTLAEAVSQIDFLGTIVLSGSTGALMAALSADEGFWKSGSLIAAFVLGLLGMISFVFLQNSRFCPHPIMPGRMFNLSSSLAFVLAFLANGIMMLVPYFLPIYFQAVLQVSPAKAGVYLLATVLTLLPAAMAIGVFVTKTGFMRSAHVGSFALMAVSAAGYMITDQHTTAAQWVPLSMIGAIGIGGMIPTALPAAQAPLPESDVAAVTATFAFFRSLGFLWGFAMPSFIFKTRVDDLIPKVASIDSATADVLRSGGAFANARASFIRSLSAPARLQVILLYVQSLSAVWKMMFGAALVGIVVAVVQPPIPLRESLDSEFGVQEHNKAQDVES
ncbi:major facilitator superfamily domain-containing protein [Lophiotrema nucula]|uniref:Major facilitator superfamily domain-containing protein n=1 Tax=Lophiotrema nucula TaxID=690887 RepID=A0A6A5YJ23_9PLEO|nr:major facilitator superfamily domain-containing protein [Lophiotrema nucula]